jgi:catechol 2,3-dioxygenase-like lactoylglutathione lyase family enzyme
MVHVLSSRTLLRPTDPERSRAFYGEQLGLAVYREFGTGSERGVVYFLGGGIWMFIDPTKPIEADSAPAAPETPIEEP